MKYHKASSKKLCSGNSYHHAEKLYKAFLGDGLYIPFLLNGKLDEETIRDHLILIKKKKEWISSLDKKLSKKKNFLPYIKELRVIEKDFNTLLTYKFKYYKSKNFSQKKKIVGSSKKAVRKFLKDLQLFIDKVDFFHSFRFPVDHFYLRRQYDAYKSIDTKAGKRNANRAYFLRKIVEEGAVDKKKGRSDLYLRAIVDSIYLRITSFHGSFLDEDLRYDIESFFKSMEGALQKGKKKTHRRIKNWHKKSIKDHAYYSGLLKNSKSKKELLKKLYADKSKARYALKNYIYKKEADVYEYWSKKPALYRKLFALETILIHEVGRLDNSYGSERRDVAKVVMNRVSNKNYNYIGEDGPLYSHLKKKKIDSKKYPLLNVLFKQGEFSFTYFFIPASRGIFCPDQSRKAKRLRRKNLRIALSELKRSTQKFKATRYFSRASMLGRIDMAQLWDQHSPLAERPGPRLKKSSKYLSLYKKNKMLFLYSFTSPKGNIYEVMRYKQKEFVYSPKYKKFYSYRNPHYFRYFLKNDSY
ncbi:MAG: hypothetical protein BM556_14300 [Bacteriovorax sp. MedPE-SWde]|nr:MAG: hypothetical protein BM556_14300 [Bacteriovorax sp. MedPE-SWde]